jgi:hypothetical protein
MVLKNQLVSNVAMRARVWAEAAWGRKVVISPSATTPPKPPPPPPPPPLGSVFAGKGVFTTSEVASAAGLNAAWTAIQKDQEGDHSETVPGRLVFWMARPTLAVALEANKRGIPFIGQAENLTELAACFALGPTLTVPKALVGNPRAWGTEGQKVALSQGWDAISEWYWNAHPWESPDGGNYPRFVNVCFGIYSEGVPGGDGYVPQSKTVADYRAVWHGSFSVWKAEAMGVVDRQAFNG